MAPRPTPFTLVFGALTAERFPVLRTALASAGVDPEQRDGFVLLRETAELLRELRPEDGLGEALEALVALLHHAYLFWQDGERVCALRETELGELLAGRLPAPPDDRPRPGYVQLPGLRVWGSPLEGQPPQPLDGWFVRRSAGDLALLAIFGLSPAHADLTAVELSGPRPVALQRLDGTPLFAPVLAGGAAAGLASVVGEAELLELAWRLEGAR